MNPNKNKLDDSNPVWSGAKEFYTFINELELDYKDGRMEANVDKMIDSFDYYYIKVLPYIQKYITDDDKKVLDDYEEIDNLRSGIRSGNTDVEEKFNMQIVNQIKALMREKSKKLSYLVARAELNIPMKEFERDVPIALTQDDIQLQ